MEITVSTTSAEASHGLLREVSTEARDDWQTDYLMEMSINTASAEASQGLLREVSTEARDDG